jgi:hypothetical protein
LTNGDAIAVTIDVAENGDGQGHELPSARAARRASLDHLVSAGDQCRRYGDPKHLGSFEIDKQLDLCGLLDRQVGRLLSIDDPSGVDP